MDLVRLEVISYVHANEPCVHPKEPYAHLKEPYLGHIVFQETLCSRIYIQKKPYLHSKEPLAHPK